MATKLTTLKDDTTNELVAPRTTSSAILMDSGFYDLEGQLLFTKNQINDFINTKGISNGIASLDGTGNVPLSQLGNVQIPSVPPYLTQDLTLYVATTGNDTTGDGSSGNPYATWGKALSVIPKNLNYHKVDIWIADGHYDETIKIENFYNSNYSYHITFHIGTAYVKYLAIYWCGVFIVGTRLTKNSGSGAFITVAYGGYLRAAIILDNGTTGGYCLNSVMSKCYIDMIYDRHSVNGQTSLVLQALSEVYIGALDVLLTGTTTTGLNVQSGILYVMNVTNLSAATRILKTGGGQIKTGAGIDLT